MTHVHLKYIAMVIVSIHQESINHSDQIFLVFKMEWFLQKYESHRLGGSCHYTALLLVTTLAAATCSTAACCMFSCLPCPCPDCPVRCLVFLTFPHYIGPWLLATNVLDQ